MRNFTKKQKKMLRRMSAVLSGCIILALTLAAVAVANTRAAVPVRFSDILEAASVTAPADDGGAKPAETVDPEFMYETLYPTELLIPEDTVPVNADSTADTAIDGTVPLNTDPDDVYAGAGGTLLLDTTATTTLPESTTETQASSVTASSATTVSTTARTTAAYVMTTTAAPRTTTTAAPKTTAHTSKKPFTNVGGGVISSNDQVYIKMLNLVNKARGEKGLNKLWYSARVHEVSTLRAYELSSYYSHERPNGKGFQTAFTDKNVAYKFAGENIAYGRNMFDTPEEVFQAWMDSQSHRENILNPNFECVAFGLATLKVGNDTYYYWTQEFAKF